MKVELLLESIGWKTIENVIWVKHTGIKIYFYQTLEHYYVYDIEDVLLMNIVSK